MTRRTDRWILSGLMDSYGALGRAGRDGRRCAVWSGLGRSWPCWQPSRARRLWLTNRCAQRSGNPAGPGRIVRRAAPDPRPAAGLVIRGFTNAGPSPRAPFASVDGRLVSPDCAGGGAHQRPLPLFAPSPRTSSGEHRLPPAPEPHRRGAVIRSTRRGARRRPAAHQVRGNRARATKADYHFRRCMLTRSQTAKHPARFSS
jgi:hypothetical protein